MIFSTFSNIVVIILCVGVLVQTTRMILAFQTFRKSDIGQTVAALDHAAARAGSVLTELRNMLATEAAANSRSLSHAEALRDELSVMVGVGNSVAERIMEAAATTAPAAHADGPDVMIADMADDQAAPAASTGATAIGRRPRRRKPTRQAAAKARAAETAAHAAGVH